MSEPITYSLRKNASTSDLYFEAIAQFTDQWVPDAISRNRKRLDSFRQHPENSLDRLHSDEEWLLEFLALGVMLREQYPESLRTPVVTLRLLKWLVSMQNRHPQWTDKIKNLRGWLNGLNSLLKRNRKSRDPLNRLLLYLEAMDESAYVKRFLRWQAYAQKQDQTEIITECLNLAEEFAAASQPVLGPYTANIPEFIARAKTDYRFRYDLYFVTRTRLQYHLTMMGTEILNRAYRQRFIETEQKIVILPPCMKALPDDSCQAVTTPFGAKCQACTPSCRVNQISTIGEAENFSVFLIPEELRVLNTGGSKASSTGVIGVSCVLTNMPGGWDAEALGIPVQGQPLDYAGCSYHWHPDGIPTDLNINQIRKILQAD